MNANRGNAGAQLATIKPQEGGTAQWTGMYDQAATLLKSGFLPSSIKTAEQALAIIFTGEELGLPKMLSLRSIHVINGRPTLSADLMASLVQREIDRHKDGLLMVNPPTTTECTVRFRRWGWKEEQSFTYSLDDAKTAGLLGKDTWKAHPGAMLRARATAAVCRMAFPDVIAGLYVPEEISEEEAESWQETGAQTHVEARVVDQETGEITEVNTDAGPPADVTDEMMNDEIKRLRLKLGWSDGRDVIRWAAEQDPPLNPAIREDKWEIVNALTDMVERELSGVATPEGSFIDAESHVAGDPGLDRHSA